MRRLAVQPRSEALLEWDLATGTGTLDSHSGKKSEIKYSEVYDARARDAR